MVKLSPLCHVQDAHRGEIWCCAFARDGITALTGGADETARVWSVGDEVERDASSRIAALAHQRTFTEYTLGCVSMDCDANSRWCATVSMDGAVRCVDVCTGTTTTVSSEGPGRAWGVAFDRTPGRSRLAVAGGLLSAVEVYEIDDDGRGEKKATLELPEPSAERFARSVAYAPDGSLIACGAMDGTVAIFDTNTGTCLHTLEGHGRPVRDVTFSPDGKTAYTACDDGYCHIYDARNRSLIDALAGHNSWVVAVTASPSSNAIVTASSDCTLKLWDLSQTRSCAQTMSDHLACVWGARFSPQGDLLLAVSADASVSLFNFV